MSDEGLKALKNITELEEKIIHEYKTYICDVDQGEMRKVCDDLLKRHDSHLQKLQDYTEVRGV